MQANRSLDLETLFRVPSIYNYDVSPGGDSLAFSWNKSGQWEIYFYDLPTRTTRQLTEGPESKISPCFAPDGNRLTFVQDYQGDENFDIFLLTLSEGESRNLTPGTAEAIYPQIRWSPDGMKLAFASNREGKFSVYVMSLSDGEVKRISDLELNYSDPEWSPDGKWLAFSGLIAAQDHGIFVSHSERASIRRLTEDGKPIEASSPRWSPDGKAISFRSSERGSSDVGIWHIESGCVDWITNSHYECYDPRWSPDGSELAYIANRQGNLNIEILNLKTYVRKTIEVDAGVHLKVRFGRDRRTMFFTFSNADHPPDLWCANPDTNEFQQITKSLPDTISRSMFVSGKPVCFPSRDGLTIPALLYLPRDSHKIQAALVYVHGGPTFQHVNEWHPLIQYLASTGYVVIAPNYRGSPGYGRDFRLANRFVLGEKDVEDVVAAADYLIENTFSKPKNTGIFGESYGGYLTMCALTKRPNHWGAGVALVPFINWFTEIQNERVDLRTWDLENMGDPEKDHNRFQNASPIFFLENISVPVQFIAGAHDPRCPISETKQACEKLQKLNKVFDLVIYEDEGHEFRKLDNRVDAFKKLVSFFDTHLKRS